MESKKKKRQISFKTINIVVGNDFAMKKKKSGKNIDFYTHKRDLRIILKKKKTIPEKI